MKYTVDTQSYFIYHILMSKKYRKDQVTLHATLPAFLYKIKIICVFYNIESQRYVTALAKHQSTQPKMISFSEKSTHDIKIFKADNNF